MDSQIYYRQASHETAERLQKWLGDTSGFAHSKTEHEGGVSKGESEREIPLMSAQRIKQMDDTQIICWHRGLPPFQGRRMDWRDFPMLRQRQAIAPPLLADLPPLNEGEAATGGKNPDPLLSWRLDSDLVRRWRPSPSSNGFKKQRTPA
jgi:type IV secretory pathway TraG/TraD family ATPase VirD4